jgi:hypothetical protein
MLDTPQPVASSFELMLARAFDLTWDQFVSVEGEIENTAENRGSLAARIVVLGKLGETDEDKLSDVALIYLRALAAAKRLNPANQTAATNDSRPGGATLNQEGIDVATAALDACLEELPERIPSEARSILSQSILENAGKGEHNGDRLRVLALEALKSRQ